MTSTDPASGSSGTDPASGSTGTDPASGSSSTDPASGSSSTDPAGRPTRQRRAVSDCLRGLDEFRSAQEIHEELRKAKHRIGLSTVYRTLQWLADSGQVDVLRGADGEARYRRCSTHHHHHLVCRSCGRTVELEGPSVERWASSVAREHGYADVTHTVELFGTCSTCTTAASSG